MEPGARVGWGHAMLVKSENLHRSYYSQVLRLAYLAPDITRSHSRGATALRSHRDNAGSIILICR